MKVKVKSLLLRTAMLGIVLLGVAGLTKPVHATVCTRGAYCETKQTFSPGSCGGRDGCLCVGIDGTQSNDVGDCAFL